MLQFAVLVASVLACLTVGIFIFARNPKNLQNRLYGLLTLGFIGLAVTNYYSIQENDNQLMFIRLVMASVTLVAAFFYFLIRFFDPSSERRLKTLDYLVLVLTPIVFVMDFSPLLFSGLKGVEHRVPIPGPGMFLYLMHLSFAFIGSLVVLFKKSFSKKGVLRNQYRILLLGVLPVGVWIITGFYMPMVLQMPDLIILSPVYTVMFVAMVGYAIVKHGLYDIRLFVFRIIAYTLSNLILALLYVAPVVLLLMYGVTEASLPVWKLLVVIATITILAINYHKLKKWFDRVSNHIFYGESYDSTAMLARLNASLATTIGIDNILVQTSAIIQDNLKTEFSVFVVRASTDSGERLVGSHRDAIDRENFVRMSTKALVDQKSGILVVDDLSAPIARKHLQDLEIGVVVMINTKSRLLSNKDSRVVMLLGHKKSGRSFDARDLSVLESIENVLSIAIQNAIHYEEIQQFNITLQGKIDDATRRLKVTNSRLKKMDETKDEFISMASHQLRTPLTSVKGYVSMVLDGDVGPINDQQRELLQQSFSSSQRMANLISDLLNLSRINTGKFVIEESEVYLPAVLETEIDQLRDMSEAKGVEIIYEPPKEFPTLMLDENKLHQVVMNFIDNALYYTPRGGTVTISLAETEKTVEFRVKDTGIGVPRSAQHHLFGKMFRADNARRARPDGTGLGLFMAKKVIVEQKGAVIFESQEGKGSTFGFMFNKDDHLVVKKADEPIDGAVEDAEVLQKKSKA